MGRNLELKTFNKKFFEKTSNGVAQGSAALTPNSRLDEVSQENKLMGVANTFSPLK